MHLTCIDRICANAASVPLVRITGGINGSICSIGFAHPPDRHLCRCRVKRQCVRRTQRSGSTGFDCRHSRPYRGDRRALEASLSVQQVVVLAMDGVVDEHGALDKSRTQVYVPNDFVRRETDRYETLLFGASVNPYRSDAIARLRAAKDGGAVLVKWIPSIMAIDPSDPRIIPFYEALVELDMPLLIHVGQERSFGAAADELGDPVRLKLPLEIGVTAIAPVRGPAGPGVTGAHVVRE